MLSTVSPRYPWIPIRGLKISTVFDPMLIEFVDAKPMEREDLMYIY